MGDPGRFFLLVPGLSSFRFRSFLFFFSWYFLRKNKKMEVKVSGKFSRYEVSSFNRFCFVRSCCCCCCCCLRLLFNLLMLESELQCSYTPLK